MSKISLAPQENLERSALPWNDCPSFGIVADALATGEPSLSRRGRARVDGRVGNCVSDIEHVRSPGLWCVLRHRPTLRLADPANAPVNRRQRRGDHQSGHVDDGYRVCGAQLPRECRKTKLIAVIIVDDEVGRSHEIEGDDERPKERTYPDGEQRQYVSRPSVLPKAANVAKPAGRLGPTMPGMMKTSPKSGAG